MTTSAIVDDMIDRLENRDWSSIEVKRYFIGKIDAAVAAAVQAEREACISALEALPTQNDDEYYTLVAAIAAIRARNGRE
jgi:hypothetical protein